MPTALVKTAFMSQPAPCEVDPVAGTVQLSGQPRSLAARSWGAPTICAGWRRSAIVMVSSKSPGLAAAVLNDSANGVAWLANKLSPHGVALEPDHVILGGSFTRPVPARPGERSRAAIFR
jgi:hypothetical protein